MSWSLLVGAFVLTATRRAPMPASWISLGTTSTMMTRSQTLTKQDLRIQRTNWNWVEYGLIKQHRSVGSLVLYPTELKRLHVLGFPIYAPKNVLLCRFITPQLHVCRYGPRKRVIMPLLCQYAAVILCRRKGGTPKRILPFIHKNARLERVWSTN